LKSLTLKIEKKMDFQNKNRLKMALLDQNCSLVKVNLGRFFKGLKFAQTSPYLGDFISLENCDLPIKVAQLTKNRPMVHCKKLDVGAVEHRLIPTNAHKLY
jgi:hypothetical protein